MIALYINLFPAPLAFKFGPFPHHLHFAFSAGSVNFHLRIRRAFAAQPFVAVPATVTGITHATAATMKMVLGLFNGGGKCLVMGLAVAGLRQSLGNVAGLIGQGATEHPGGAAQPAGCLPTAKRNKFTAPRVATTLAVKFKLETGIGARLNGMVGKIFAKMNFAHGNAFLNSLIKFNYGNRKFRAKKLHFEALLRMNRAKCLIAWPFVSVNPRFLENSITARNSQKNNPFIEIIEERGNVKERSADDNVRAFF
jgi:hypothetical protein